MTSRIARRFAPANAACRCSRSMFLAIGMVSGIVGAGAAQPMITSRQTPLIWTEVPIVNPGFEDASRVLAPGEQSNGARGASESVGTYSYPDNGEVSLASPVTVAGWRTYAANTPTTKLWGGAMRPWMITPQQPYLTGYGGQHVGVSRITPIQQTINLRLAPNTVYRLTFRAGYGHADFSSGVYVALIAAPNTTALVFRGDPGVPTLAATEGGGMSPPPEGTMAEYTVEYISPAVLPTALAGRFLAISIIGSDGLPSMCFDDFRLRIARLPRAAVGARAQQAP